MKVINLIICCFLFYASWGEHISTGWLQGCVVDEATDEALIGANLYIERNGIFVMGMSSDYEGRFRGQLPAGTYDVLIDYTGYSDHTVSGVLIRTGAQTRLDVKLNAGVQLDEVVVVSYKVPLIEKDNTTSGATISMGRRPSITRSRTTERKRRKGRKRASKSKDVTDLPTKSVAKFHKLASSAKDSDLNVKGSRAAPTDYYIDGIRIKGSDTVAPSSEPPPSAPEHPMPYSEADFPEDESRPEPEIRQKASAGSLTAGEINDFSKWDLWGDISGEDLAEYRQQWGIEPVHRYSVQLVNTSGQAVVDAAILLQQGTELVWASKTDNTGKAELWANAFGTTHELDQLSLKAIYEDTSYDLGTQLKTFHEGLNRLEIPADCTPHQMVDIAFVVDATSSMQDEILYLKAELGSLLKNATEIDPTLMLQTAGVFFRDREEEYLVRKTDFSRDLEETMTFIQNNYARGGGDFPEAVEVGLQTAISDLEWSGEARARLLFLILDAPPRDEEAVKKLLQEQIQLAARKGIRIIPLSCSGVDKSTEYLMRSLALLTNGTYTFLTDDSGIGLSHIEPTTDSYTTELLDDLFLRLFFEFTYVPDCDALATSSPAVPNAWLQQRDMDRRPTPEPEQPSFHWKYYPNPSSGIVNVEFSEPVKFFYVFDLSGKLLRRIEWPEEKTMRVDLTGFSKGIYLLHYEGPNGERGSGKLTLVDDL